MDVGVCLDNKIVLHIADPSDLPAIYKLVDLYRDDVDNPAMGFNVNKDIAKAYLRDLTYLKGSVLVERNGEYIGGIAGHVMPGAFTQDLIFSVMFFYIRPEFRCFTWNIIKELKLVLLPTKVTRIVFGVLANEESAKRQRFMRMLGYKPLEVHMEKRLTHAET